MPEVAIDGFDGHQGRVWAVKDGRLAQVALIFGHRTEDARVEASRGCRRVLRSLPARLRE